MKRTERVTAISNLLLNSPSKLFSLQYFCELFGCAKSSISEDLQTANQALLFNGTGSLETVTGRDGGVMYVPSISDKEFSNLQEVFKERLSDYNRLVGGNFMYTSDIFGDSNIINPLARAFARKYSNLDADYVVTVETKGIPLAASVAHYLNLPLVIIRREARISEGSTVSINYFSGSSERLQKMSMSKRAIESGSKVLIIDDFMRGGGTMVGIEEMVREFGSEVVGCGVAIASKEPANKKVKDYSAILFLGDIDSDTKEINIEANCEFF